MGKILYLLMINTEEDKRKFETIYFKYKNLMLNRAYEILKDKGLAEDAVQNACMSIIKNISKINTAEPHQLKSYVVIITENSAKKIYNKRNKIIEVDLMENLATSSVEKSVEDSSQVQFLVEKIRGLSDIYRDVLILKFINELDDKEIAQSLNIKLATVQKRIYRGKQILLSALKEGENIE